MKNDPLAAEAFFQRATVLDPSFAMAYASLGTAYVNESGLDVAKLGLSQENAAKAYALRDRVSEREKFYIDTHYYQFALVDQEKSEKAYELWRETYPADAKLAATNLSAIHEQLGDLDAALSEAQQALKLDPNSGISFNNLSEVYVQMGRLDEALAVIQQAQEKNLDSGGLHALRYRIADLRNDQAEMAKQVAAASRIPELEDAVLGLQEAQAAMVGQFSKAAEISHRRIEAAKRKGDKGREALIRLGLAYREMMGGNDPPAQNDVRAALALSSSQIVETQGAALLALLGDTHAEQVADDLTTHYPDNTFVQRIFLPMIQALIAMNKGNTAQALEIIKPAERYDLGTVAALGPAFVRGHIDLAAKKGSEAAVEFQKILDHRSVVGDDPKYQLAYLGLARARVLSGDIAGARTAYEDFFAAWKDADADLPVLVQAKAEYAKLK